MDRNQYLYDIDNIPSEHKDLFIGLNSAMLAAMTKHDKGIKSLTRTPISGDYYFFDGNELIEINQWQHEDTGERGYMVSELHDKWHWDPVAYLWQARETLLGS